MQQRPSKFCCCVYNPKLDTQCTTTVNHGGILKNAQKVHVTEEDSWMLGTCIRQNAKRHDGGYYVSCISKKCTGVTFRLIKSSVKPMEVFFLVLFSPLPYHNIFALFGVTKHSRNEGKWAHWCGNRRLVFFPFWPFVSVSFHSRSFFPGQIWSRECWTSTLFTFTSNFSPPALPSLPRLPRPSRLTVARANFTPTSRPRASLVLLLLFQKNRWMAQILR
jgi:hypothetical protein